MGNDENSNGTNKPTRGKTLSKPMREAMLNFVSDKYLQGFSYRQIAKQIEESFPRTITIVTVGNMIHSLLSEWKAERINRLDDLKTVELARINRLENTYWDGWTRSLSATERKTEKQRAIPGTSVVPGGETVKTMNPVSAEKSTYIEETYGDPRFLAGIQWCIAMRCKILGIEAPIEFKGSMTSVMRTITNFHTRKRERP